MPFVSIARASRQLPEWDIIYPYYGLEGPPLFVMGRRDTADGKEILPFRKVETEWVRGLPPDLEKLPLYYRREISQRYSKKQEIGPFVAEGEKTVEALNKLLDDFVCTTSQGGANAAHKSDWSPLAYAAKAGNTIYLCPDNDKPGMGYIASVASEILKINADAKFKLICACAQGGIDGFDFADWCSIRGVK